MKEVDQSKPMSEVYEHLHPLMKQVICRLQEPGWQPESMTAKNGDEISAGKGGAILCLDATPESGVDAYITIQRHERIGRHGKIVPVAFGGLPVDFAIVNCPGEAPSEIVEALRHLFSDMPCVRVYVDDIVDDLANLHFEQIDEWTPKASFVEHVYEKGFDPIASIRKLTPGSEEYHEALWQYSMSWYFVAVRADRALRLLDNEASFRGWLGADVRGQCQTAAFGDVD